MPIPAKRGPPFFNLKSPGTTNLRDYFSEHDNLAIIPECDRAAFGDSPLQRFYLCLVH